MNWKQKIIIVGLAQYGAETDAAGRGWAQKELEKENNGEIDRAERRKMKGVVQKREKEGWAGKK